MSGANFNITTLTALNENSPGGVADKYISRGDPSAVDFSVGDFTTDGAVHSLDLSSIIPTEAAGKMVHLTVDVRDDATSSIYFRTKGNTNWIAASRCVVINTSSGVANSYDIFVACDDNRELEYLTPNATFVKIDVTVRGWLVPAGGGDWVDWTPVSTWVTNATHTGKYRLVNGVMEGYFKIALTGEPTAGTSLVIDLPSGYTLDTSVITNDQNRRLGDLTIYDAAPGLYFGCTRIYSGTEIVCAVFRADTTFQQVYSVQAITPITFANGDSVYGEFRIPVVAV